MDSSHALIFDFYHGTTHDGPGIRSTVFFKGCPLKCAWCHNPEGISPKQQIWWDSTRCIGCHFCLNICNSSAVISDENGIRIDENKCIRCLKCTDICPAKALSTVAKEYSLDEVMNILIKYKQYFGSEGGVTASGGEATTQGDFVHNLFILLHEHGINTALDTCGYVNFELLEKLAAQTDYILYDIKIFDDKQHQIYTGVSNRLIIENIKKLVGLVRDKKIKSKIWIRTPLIPGASAEKNNIAAIADFLQPYLGNEIERWEMCAFNNACTSKYKKMGKSWDFSSNTHLTQQYAEELRNIAINSGIASENVLLTGILV